MNGIDKKYYSKASVRNQASTLSTRILEGEGVCFTGGDPPGRTISVSFEREGGDDERLAAGIISSRSCVLGDGALDVGERVAMGGRAISPDELLP
jgi:hypothetical protein